MTEYAHDASDEVWLNFHRAVLAAYLIPHKCGPSHWQIKGGNQYRLVNCWPNTKKGFRFQAEGGAVRSGTVSDAIELAGAPVKSAEPPWGDGKVETTLRTIAEAERPVGLIRRFWRWLW